MRLSCLAFYAATAAACLLAQESSSVTGNWVNEFSFLDQKGYNRMTIQLESASVRGSMGEDALTGSFRNGRIEFSTNSKHPLKANGVLENGEIHGEAVEDGETLKWRAYREPTPRPPKVHEFEPTQFHRHFSGAIPPVLHLFPGDTVKTWTVDAGGRDSKGRRLSNGGNPETGPFYIEGALPGDVITVTLNRVRLNRDTAMSSPGIVPSAYNPGFTANLEKVKDFNAEWILDREHGVARMKEPTEKLKNYTIPLRPMLGCIGVAPGGDMVFRSGFLGAFGGNMDYNEVREGVTVSLPVNKPGALLFVGDGHAAQGDGELTGDALETSMDIEFTVGLIRDGGRAQRGPRFENAEYIMASGIGGSLTDALQMSTTELSRWLAHDYGLNPAEISAVFGTAMRYDIAEIVDPYVHVVAKLNKTALSRLKPVQK